MRIASTARLPILSLKVLMQRFKKRCESGIFLVLATLLFYKCQHAAHGFGLLDCAKKNFVISLKEPLMQEPFFQCGSGMARWKFCIITKF